MMNGSLSIGPGVAVCMLFVGSSFSSEPANSIAKRPARQLTGRSPAAVSETKPAPEATSATAAEDSTDKEKIVWGRAKHGLVANLRALTADVKPGDPIELEFRLKNVSQEDAYYLSGLGGGRISPCVWVFRFGQWEWRPRVIMSCGRLRLAPGETASGRCAVVAPFRNGKSGEKSVRLPEGSYRVYASNGDLETNVIEVRIIDPPQER